MKRSIVKLVVMMSFVALAAVPTAQAGILGWAGGASGYHIGEAECWSGPSSSCQPDCGVRLTDVVCAATGFGQIIYEAHVGDYPG